MEVTIKHNVNVVVKGVGEFRCMCGCSLFTVYLYENLRLFVCEECGKKFLGETDEPEKQS